MAERCRFRLFIDDWEFAWLQLAIFTCENSSIMVIFALLRQCCCFEVRGLAVSGHDPKSHFQLRACNDLSQEELLSRLG